MKFTVILIIPQQQKGDKPVVTSRQINKKKSTLKQTVTLKCKTILPDTQALNTHSKRGTFEGDFKKGRKYGGRLRTHDYQKCKQMCTVCLDTNSVCHTRVRTNPGMLLTKWQLYLPGYERWGKLHLTPQTAVVHLCCITLVSQHQMQECWDWKKPKISHK